jgi:hypothetical protein
MRNNKRINEEENNLIYNLVTMLGSPFVKSMEKNLPLKEKDKENLYQLATKNKVGLFLLERLKEIGELTPRLEIEYSINMNRYEETLKTAINLSSTIAKVTNDFAIFKFFKPYPHTPSDVDVLFFLEKTKYDKVVSYLLSNGYAKVGECPSQVVVYDMRGGLDNMDRNMVDGKKGGKYYIDLYNEVSASHLIYLDKELLSDKKTNISFSVGKIQMLSPVADLAVVLSHSIIPEQLFTLGDFYTCLYYIKQMDERELSDLIEIFNNSKMTKAAIYSLSLTAALHNEVFGFIPKPILYLLKQLDKNIEINKNYLNNTMILPYRYQPSVIIWVLLERLTSISGFKSISKQIACTLVNPRLAKWVIYNIVLRRKRSTY